MKFKDAVCSQCEIDYPSVSCVNCGTDHKNYVPADKRHPLIGMMFDVAGVAARLAELDTFYNQLWQVSGIQPEALLEMFAKGYVLKLPEYVTIEDFVEGGETE